MRLVNSVLIQLRFHVLTDTKYVTLERSFPANLVASTETQTDIEFQHSINLVETAH